MLKKIAIFVEGLTEQEFVIQLIKELAGSRGVEFEIHNQFRGILSFTELRSGTNPSIHVLVANCCTDGQVKTQIVDRYEYLKSLNYTLIIGLRDVHPFTHKDIPDLTRMLTVGLPNDSVPIQMHLAVMEIEAWFLEELTHYSKIDMGLNIKEVITGGFDPSLERAHQIQCPADTLHSIYSIVGLSYKKKKNQIERTVSALSYEHLYLETRHLSPSLDTFLHGLEVGLFA